MRPILAAIFCLAALGAAATQPVSPDLGDTLAKAQDEIRQQLRSQWAPLPELPPTPLADIIRLHIANDWLIADSPIYQGKSANNRISIPNIDGLGNLRLTTSRSPGSYYIYFEFHDFTQPGLVEREIELLSAPITLQIDQDDVYADDQSLSVSLEETIDPGAEAPVTLRVQHPSSNEAFTATSLSDLRRKYPLQFERYFRPLMRNFQQERVGFRVDDRTAWQVLSDTWRPPPDLPAKVQTIVAQLNADDYSSRAAAQKQLDQLGQPAALYLMSITQPTLTPEQSARLAKFLVPYRPLDDAQLALFRKDQNFLLDCLFSDDSTLRTAALQHLRLLTGRDLQFDSDQPSDQRIDAIRHLRDELSPATQPTGN